MYQHGVASRYQPSREFNLWYFRRTYANMSTHLMLECALATYYLFIKKTKSLWIVGSSIYIIFVWYFTFLDCLGERNVTTHYKGYTCGEWWPSKRSFPITFRGWTTWINKPSYQTSIDLYAESLSKAFAKNLTSFYRAINNFLEYCLLINFICVWVLENL